MRLHRDGKLLKISMHTCTNEQLLVVGHVVHCCLIEETGHNMLRKDLCFRVGKLWAPLRRPGSILPPASSAVVACLGLPTSSSPYNLLMALIEARTLLMKTWNGS